MTYWPHIYRETESYCHILKWKFRAFSHVSKTCFTFDTSQCLQWLKQHYCQMQKCVKKITLTKHLAQEACDNILCYA